MDGNSDFGGVSLIPAPPEFTAGKSWVTAIVASASRKLTKKFKSCVLVLTCSARRIHDINCRVRFRRTHVRAVDCDAVDLGSAGNARGWETQQRVGPPQSSTSSADAR